MKMLILLPVIFLASCTCAAYTVTTPEKTVLDVNYCSTKEFKKVDITHGDVVIKVDGVQNNLVPDVAGAVTKGAVQGAVGGMASEILKKKAMEALTNE